MPSIFCQLVRLEARAFRLIDRIPGWRQPSGGGGREAAGFQDMAFPTLSQCQRGTLYRVIRNRREGDRANHTDDHLPEVREFAQTMTSGQAPMMVEVHGIGERSEVAETSRQT